MKKILLLMLSTFCLQGAEFIGSVEDFLALEDKASLRYLAIMSINPNIQTPTLESISRLEKLTILDLANNWLIGNIPEEILNLVNLTELYLSDNALTGDIPLALGNLVNLTYLSLSCNKLTGNIPAVLGNLVNLTSLDLYHNQLTGDIPSALGKLVNLTYLALSENQLSGDIPAELGNLMKLTNLYVSNKNLDYSSFNIYQASSLENQDLLKDNLHITFDGDQNSFSINLANLKNDELTALLYSPHTSNDLGRAFQDALMKDVMRGRKVTINGNKVSLVYDAEILPSGHRSNEWSWSMPPCEDDNSQHFEIFKNMLEIVKSVKSSASR
jgi:hypothetical protein